MANEEQLALLKQSERQIVQIDAEIGQRVSALYRLFSWIGPSSGFLIASIVMRSGMGPSVGTRLVWA